MGKALRELPLRAEAEAMATTLAAYVSDRAKQALDVACDPGILACAFAERAIHVTGIDLTPAMIEQACVRQDAAELGNVTWHVGDATSLPFADAGFDVVTTRYSFHHIPDPAAVLAEMKRVCRPDGRIVAIDATPTAETHAAYIAMETLRDPFHTSALTLDQLHAVGTTADPGERMIGSYRLEARLHTLLDEKDMAEMETMFEADIASGHDWIGGGAWRNADGIGFCFLISIVAWTPAAA